MKHYSLFTLPFLCLFLLLSFAHPAESQPPPRLVLFEAFMRPT